MRKPEKEKRIPLLGKEGWTRHQEKAAEGALSWRGRGGPLRRMFQKCIAKHFILTDHPVCAFIGGLRQHLLDGAATPPVPGGESARLFQRAIRIVATGIVILAIVPSDAQIAGPQDNSAAVPPPALLNQYCITCHHQRAKTGGLALDTMDFEHVGKDAAVWEKVVRKIRTGMMPPSGARSGRIRGPRRCIGSIVPNTPT